jgi:hypothetical protein
MSNTTFFSCERIPTHDWPQSLLTKALTQASRQLLFDLPDFQLSAVAVYCEQGSLVGVEDSAGSCAVCRSGLSCYFIGKHRVLCPQAAVR